jgi:hypothetical protein
MKTILSFTFVLVLCYVSPAQTYNKNKVYEIFGPVLQKTERGLLMKLNAGVNKPGYLSYLSQEPSIILLSGHPDAETLVDGDEIKCLVKLVGTFEYTTTNGGTKTVREWHITKGPDDCYGQSPTYPS